MKKDRKKLELTLQNFIQNYIGSKRKLKDNLVKKLANNNISAGKALGLSNLSIPLVTIGIAELYLFTKALYEITNEELLNPEKWFNEEEEKNYTLYKEQIKYNNDVIVLHDVKQNSDNHWMCSKATYQEISKIHSQGLVTYNMRTQREPLFVKFNNNNVINSPNIKQKPIREMSELMVNDKFKPNTLTWNIRRTGEEMLPEYDKKNQTLSIPVDNVKSFCDIIDGMHRTCAIMRCTEKKPNTEGYMMISIFYYTEDEAKEYIDQEANHTPISKAQRKAFRSSDTEIIMAKDINSFGNENNNIMFNKFANTYDELKYENKYLTFETFSESLKYSFTIENPREVTKITKYLREYFNDILGILDENNIKYENNVFIGLTSIAGKLYNNKEWQNILENNTQNIIKAIDELSESELNNKKLTNPFIKKISEKFAKAVDLNV